MFQTTSEARHVLIQAPEKFRVNGGEIRHLTMEEPSAEEWEAIEFLVDDCGFTYDSALIR